MAHQNIASFQFASGLLVGLAQIIMNGALLGIRRQANLLWARLDDAEDSGVRLTHLVQNSTIGIEEAVGHTVNASFLTFRHANRLGGDVASAAQRTLSSIQNVPNRPSPGGNFRSR